MSHVPIPFIDLRGKTPIDLLRAYPDRARDMLKAARRSWGVFSDAASLAALPVADRLSHRWLKKRRNPYLYEIETFADLVRKPGVVALNLSFEWGCTAGVWRAGETVALLRTLDWPFPAMGKYAVVALQEGKAGAFYNITWPALSGVFTGMAPGRFSAAINQAPSRMHGLTLPGDWIKNRLLLRRENGLPPSHVLRQAFERAATYMEAKAMLAQAPLAIPAIFTLAGTEPGQGCVIERLERDAVIRELGADSQVSTANHFIGALHHAGGWRPREIDSKGRYRQSLAIGAHELDQPHFGWLSAPIINARTRLAILADAGEPRLMVQGFEGPLPVTGVFAIAAAEEPARRAV